MTTEALLPTTPARSDAWLRRAAARDIAAVSPGVVPFGVVLGVAAASAHSGAGATLLGAVLVYGGSAQLTTLTALHVGTGLLAAVLSGALVNARIMLYGAALEPRFQDQPTWFRLLAPQFVLDQTYLSAVERPEITGRAFRCYWTWLGLILLGVWTAAVGAGLLVGPALPPLPHLGLVSIALFVSMLVPRLVSRENLVAAGVAVAVALLTAEVAPQLAVVVATVAGVVAAVLVSGRR